MPGRSRPHVACAATLTERPHHLDTVNGGTGTDKARRDTIDVLLSIEGSL